MFNRIAIFGLALFFVTAGTLSAASSFPKTAEDYALVYEMQLYQQLKGNSAEFRRRVKIAEQVIKGYKKSDSQKANEPIAIQWFQAASRSGGALPDLPGFANAAAASRTATKRKASQESVQPEAEWARPTATPPAGNPADLADANDVADNSSDSSDAWSLAEIDEAFGITSADDGNESLVTADASSTSVIKKGASTAANDASSMASDLAAKVWGAATGTPATNDLAALGSEEGSGKTPAVESLPTFSTDSAEGDVVVDIAGADGTVTVESGVADVWGDANGASGGQAVTLPFGGGASGSAATGIVPMALFGGIVLTGIISLVCMVTQLISAFKHSAALGIVSLVFCGIGGLVIGWVKHKEWGITKTMKVWTACTIVGILLQLAMGFVTAMG